MKSIFLQPFFRYMLAGVAVLLLLSSVEALPTKSAVSCPIRAPKSKLHKRSPLTHPSATKATTLFHGTQKASDAKNMAAGVDLSKTHVCGDLHDNKKHGSEGGAYFTDSVITAAQFACYKDAYDSTLPLPETVHVLDFTWTPGSYKVFEFEEKDKYKLSDAQCGVNDMVTGPMWNPFTDKSFTAHFWQYALVKQEATKGLAYHHTYEVHCKNVPKGDALTDELYAHGQGGNANFKELVAQLTAAPSC